VKSFPFHRIALTLSPLLLADDVAFVAILSRFCCRCSSLIQQKSGVPLVLVSHSVVATGMDLSITAVEIIIPAMSGMAKHSTWRNLAEPEDSDSAMNGKMNDASIAIAHTAAFIPISFFFCNDVMIVTPSYWCEVANFFCWLTFNVTRA
jgi:hypothetical protein